MTVSSSDTFVVFRGNGATVNFPYTFRIPDATYAHVYLRDFTTKETTEELDSGDYSITGTTWDNYSGGIVTYNPGIALSNSFEIVIERIVPFIQPLNLDNQGGFFADSLEQALDLTEMQAQQLNEIAERALVSPIGEMGLTLPPLADLKGMALGFDPTTGTPMAIDADSFDAQISADEAAASAAAAHADRLLADADVVLSHADVVLTHADVVLTHADVVLAEAARDSALLTGNLFVDIATGLANTSGTGSTDRYFGVPSAGSTFITEYKNNAGSETLINTYSSTAGVVTLLSPPNATMTRYKTLVTGASASLSAADQTALRYLEYGLRELQLNDFFLRINPQLGDIAAGARIPFLQATGVGFSEDTGTISSWTESDGLKTGPLDTGVTLQAARLDVRDCLLGVYNLADPNGGVGSGFSIGNAGQGWGLQSDRTGDNATSSAGLYLFDVAGVVFGSTYRRTTGPVSADCTTKGPMSGYRAPDGRNGIVLCDYPLVNGNFGDRRPVDPTLTIAEPSGTIQVTGKSTHGCGGYWIARGMPEPAIIAFHRLYHRCMIIAGRAVDAEGY